jgi:epoxyqueuosine reductase
MRKTPGEQIKIEIARHGDKSSIVPVERLRDIRRDIEELQSRESLNALQRHIVNDIYSVEPPSAGFEVRSIIIVASPSASSARLVFGWEGKRIPLTLPAAYVDAASAPAGIAAYLSEFLGPLGHHIQYASRLPRKLLAVRSGLGLYGRNNICYVEGMGSFLNLALFFSDVPCTEESWQEVRRMDLCSSCRACLQNCPTGAIMAGRFLIDNERCLTYYNEAGAESRFPEWIDPSSHNCLYGCSRCQSVCPANKKNANSVVEVAEFTEEETQLLLMGESIDRFPEQLARKVRELDMVQYLGALPRNLPLLFGRQA